MRSEPDKPFISVAYAHSKPPANMPSKFKAILFIKKKKYLYSLIAVALFLHRFLRSHWTSSTTAERKEYCLAAKWIGLGKVHYEGVYLLHGTIKLIKFSKIIKNPKKINSDTSLVVQILNFFYFIDIYFFLLF